MRIQESDEAAQPEERRGFDRLTTGWLDAVIYRSGQLLTRVRLAAIPRTHAPGRQPSAGIPAARHGGEIVEAAEHARAREALQHTEREAGAAHAAARQTKRGVLGLLMPAKHCRLGRNVVRRRRSVRGGPAMQAAILVVKDLMQR